MDKTQLSSTLQSGFGYFGQSELLTPTATSPLPFSINETPKSYISSSPQPSFPMISMLPNLQENHISMNEINLLAEEIEDFSHSSDKSIKTPMNLPSIPSVNLPTFSTNSPKDLPFVSKNLPQIPLVNLGSYIPTLLADNETADLKWNRPNPPKTKTYYRVGCIGDGSCFFHAISKGLSEIYQSTYRDFDSISEEELRNFESAVNRRTLFPPILFTSPRGNNLTERYTFSQPYGKIAFKDILNNFREIYVKMLRQDFANRILNDDRMKGLIRRRLSGTIDRRIDKLIARAADKGLNRRDFQDIAFQDVIRNLAQELLSGNAVQPDFMLLLSDYVNVDIYLLRDIDLIDPDPRNTPLYSGASLHATIHGPANMRSRNDIYFQLPNRPAIVIIAVDDFHYEIIARSKDGQICPNMTQEEPLIHRLYEILRDLRAAS